MGAGRGKKPENRTGKSLAATIGYLLRLKSLDSNATQSGLLDFIRVKRPLEAKELSI